MESLQINTEQGENDSLANISFSSIEFSQKDIVDASFLSASAQSLENDFITNLKENNSNETEFLQGESLKPKAKEMDIEKTENNVSKPKDIIKHDTVSEEAPKITENEVQDHKSRDLFYTIMRAEIEGILEEETDFLANTANIASFMYHKYHKSFGTDSINWLGFYFVRTIETDNLKKKELRLGPFHGKYACVRIGFGKGVCGTCALKKETILVPDVHLFPNHIACDEASESEIVIPLIDENDNNRLIGLLDIDCPVKNGFDKNDQKHLEKIAKLIAQGCNWPKNDSLMW